MTRIERAKELIDEYYEGLNNYLILMMDRRYISSEWEQIAESLIMRFELLCEIADFTEREVIMLLSYCHKKRKSNGETFLPSRIMYSLILLHGSGICNKYCYFNEL